MIRDHHDRIVQGLRDREPVQQIATAVGCTRQGLDLYIATAGLTPLRDEARAWHEQQAVQRAMERARAAKADRQANQNRQRCRQIHTVFGSQRTAGRQIGDGVGVDQNRVANRQRT